MLLVIHNLPKMMRYEEVKALIKERCNLTNIIVDNLVLETTLTRKVTIGLSDDADAAKVFKELNGKPLGGRKLVVEDLRKNKDSDMRFQSPMNQDNNVMPSDIALQYTTYNQLPVGNYYAPNRGTVQNTQMQYTPAPCPPVYGNTQQQAFNAAAPDFIPFGGEGKSNDLYGGGQSDRYFNWKDDNKYSAPDTRGMSYSNDENTSKVWRRNRSDDYKGGYESDDAKVDAGRDSYRWSRGDGRDNRTRGADGSGERSRRFETAFEPQYDSRPVRNEPKYDSRPVRNELKYDSRPRRNEPKYDSRPGRNEPKYDSRPFRNEPYDSRPVRNEPKYDSRPIRNEPKYNRAPERPKGDRFQKPNPHSNYNPRFPEQSVGRQKEHASPARGYQNRSEYKPMASVNAYKNPLNESRGQPHLPRRGNSVYELPKSEQKTPDNAEALNNKDGTWRGQAVSAIVKDLLAENGMQDFVKKQFFMSYVKPIVRSKIDAMLGNRKAVPLPQIIEEYKRKNTAAAQREFIIDVRNKYECLKVEGGETNKEEYEATVHQLDSQNRNPKRPATGPPITFQGNALKKQKKKPKQETKTFQRPKTPTLPKYPNNDKIAYKKLKRLEIAQPDIYEHRLNVELKNALNKEIDVLCDLFREECQKAEDNDEKEICRRIQDTVEAFKKEMNFNLSKRLLNITKNLPVRVYTDQKVNSKEVKEKLKSLGIATFRKTMGKHMYIATCNTYEQFDYLCAQETFILDGVKIWFRPLHMGRPQRNLRKNKAKANQNEMNAEKGYANDDNDEEFGDEEGGGDEFDFCEEDDEMGGDFFANDERKDGKEDVKIIKSEDGNNTKLTEETETVTKVKVEISDENNKSDDTKPSHSKIESAESTAIDTQEQKTEPSNEVNEVKNAETVKPIQNILVQELSNSINNKENTDDVDQKKAETIEQNDKDISDSDQHIDQDDLEDF